MDAPYDDPMRNASGGERLAFRLELIVFPPQLGGFGVKPKTQAERSPQE